MKPDYSNEAITSTTSQEEVSQMKVKETNPNRNLSTHTATNKCRRTLTTSTNDTIHPKSGQISLPYQTQQ